MATIYFMSDGENIKVGRTTNEVDLRKEQLQVGNAKNLEILYIIPNMKDSFENHIHDICKRYHVRGEWFTEEVIPFLLRHPWYSEKMELLK